MLDVALHRKSCRMLKNIESVAEEVQKQNFIELIARLAFIFTVVLPLLEKKGMICTSEKYYG